MLVNASATGGPPAVGALLARRWPGTALARGASGTTPPPIGWSSLAAAVAPARRPSDETWVLVNANGLGGTPTWARLPAAGPSARYAHAATYDSAGNRLFVHGGVSGDAAPPSRTPGCWTERTGWVEPAWRALAPGGTLPAARRFATLSLDPASGRLVLFGGREADGSALADAHVLVDPAGPAPEWSELHPASAPPARFGHTAAFDPATRRLLVYGGTNAGLEEGLNYVFGDAWMLTDADGRGDAPEWVRIDAGPAPLGRFATAAAWSASANRLLVFGGANNKLAAPPTDYWLLGDAFGQLPLVSAGQTTRATWRAKPKTARCTSGASSRATRTAPGAARPRGLSAPTTPRSSPRAQTSRWLSRQAPPRSRARRATMGFPPRARFATPGAS